MKSGLDRPKERKKKFRSRYRFYLTWTGAFPKILKKKIILASFPTNPGRDKTERGKTKFCFGCRLCPTQAGAFPEKFKKQIVKDFKKLEKRHSSFISSQARSNRRKNRENNFHFEYHICSTQAGALQRKKVKKIQKKIIKKKTLFWLHF